MISAWRKNKCCEKLETILKFCHPLSHVGMIKQTQKCKPLELKFVLSAVCPTV